MNTRKLRRLRRRCDKRRVKWATAPTQRKADRHHRRWNKLLHAIAHEEERNGTTDGTIGGGG